MTYAEGQRLGSLTLLRKNGMTNNGRNVMWLCRCACGTEITVSTGNLRRQKSCGCLYRQAMAARQTTHGEAARGELTAEYKIWRGMVNRCHRRWHDAYPRYGGAGVMVADRWRIQERDQHPFECFLEDMGRRPSPDHSLDRYPDRDGDYRPGNVRWATQLEQQRNRRDTHMVTVDGEEVPRIELAERAGIHIGAVEARLAGGWSLERALTTPSRAKSPKLYNPHRRRKHETAATP